MENIENEQAKYAAAKSHVAALKGFYIHAVVFAAVMTGLFGIDFASGGSWWVQWPLLGWGLGLAGHAYLVFAKKRHSVGDWEQRKIRETLSKM